jgi:hypothetical protein
VDPATKLSLLMANTVLYRRDGGEEVNKKSTSSESFMDNQNGFSEQLDEHLRSTTNQIQWNKFTLTFIDIVDEEGFRNFNAPKLVGWWRYTGPAGIVFMGLFQLIYYLLVLSDSQIEIWKELIIIPIVYIPMLLLLFIVLLGNPLWTERYVQYFSLVYIIFIGPVFNLSRSMLFRDVQNTYGFVTAPFYITILYCFTYFMRLRFIFCIVLFLIAYPAWLVPAYSAHRDTNTFPTPTMSFVQIEVVCDYETISNEQS